jgi:hypothetical protein
VTVEVEDPFAVIDAGDAEIAVVEAATAPGLTVKDDEATEVVRAGLWPLVCAAVRVIASAFV